MTVLAIEDPAAVNGMPTVSSLWKLLHHFDCDNVMAAPTGTVSAKEDSAATPSRKTRQCRRPQTSNAR
ncbi:MAG TPA: hypothetical protein VIS74_02740, partial [Chthoniobacterales bacterium]